MGFVDSAALARLLCREATRPLGVCRKPTLGALQLGGRSSQRILQPRALAAFALPPRAFATEPAGGSLKVSTGAGAGALEATAAASPLADLADRSAFLPKPEAFDERLRPGFRGGRALLIFFACNAVPFGALLYYLREQREARAQLTLAALPVTAEDVAAEALRTIRTAAVCLALSDAPETAASARGGAAANLGALRVDPFPPERSAYVPPTEPLPLLPQLERNVVTDLLEAPANSGLGFVHFTVSRNSPLGAAALAGDRRASLLYVSHVRGAYCTVNGQLSVLSDAESKRRYWKPSWIAAFPPAAAVEATPRAVGAGAAGASPAEPAPPWLHEDCLLLRLAVNDVTLRATVDGPQRWQARSVRRVRGSGDASEAGQEWSLLEAAH
eukprot:TRINITY_DN21602_c0_g6_i1.p1 TRINITY_DN21602_c0_g6~~TRINITY_DN21602_c0_g6_i1.p1  ORF type:complete len:434 (+),score=97.91 TRINITY_DN21602_c0_g6_i1:145-1302(+)